MSAAANVFFNIDLLRHILSYCPPKDPPLPTCLPVRRYIAKSMFTCIYVVFLSRFTIILTAGAASG
jgi:hypothetical protein